MNKYYLHKSYDVDLSLLVAGALTELINQEMGFSRQVYSYKGVSDNLKIVPSFKNLGEIIAVFF